MSIEYANSIRSIMKLIPSRYNTVTNSEFLPIDYYNGNSFIISPIKYAWGSRHSDELALGHGFVLSHVNRVRSVEAVASAKALPTELGSRTLGNPRISKATWAIAK